MTCAKLVMTGSRMRSRGGARLSPPAPVLLAVLAGSRVRPNAGPCHRQRPRQSFGSTEWQQMSTRPGTCLRSQSPILSVIIIGARVRSCWGPTLSSLAPILYVGVVEGAFAAAAAALGPAVITRRRARLRRGTWHVLPAPILLAVLRRGFFAPHFYRK